MVMENSKSQDDKAQADESKGKTGVIPNEEVNGSDADSAYNEDQEFDKPNTSESENKQHKNA